MKLTTIIVTAVVAATVTGCQTTAEMNGAQRAELTKKVMAKCSALGYRQNPSNKSGFAHWNYCMDWHYRNHDVAVLNDRAAGQAAALAFSQSLAASSAAQQGAYQRQVNGMQECKYYRPAVTSASRPAIYTNCY